MVTSKTNDQSSLAIPIYYNIKELYEAAGFPIQEIHPHFHIQRYEVLRPKSIAQMAPYRNDFYSIHIFTNITEDSQLIVTNNTISHLRDSHTVAFNSPGQLLQWKFTGSRISGFALHFKAEFVTFYQLKSWIAYEFPLFNFNTFNLLSIETDSENRLVFLCEQMLREYHSKAKAQFQIIQSYLNILIIELNRLYEKQYGPSMTPKEAPSSRAYALVQNFQVLIWKHLYSKHTLEEYADLLNVSASYLSDIVKQVYGKNASQLLQDSIINEAKKLLLQSNLSITQIGYELGFKDPSHFSKYFKSATSQTPLEFRREVS